MSESDAADATVAREWLRATMYEASRLATAVSLWAAMREAKGAHGQGCSWPGVAQNNTSSVLCFVPAPWVYSPTRANKAFAAQNKELCKGQSVLNQAEQLESSKAAQQARLQGSPPAAVHRCTSYGCPKEHRPWMLRCGVSVLRPPPASCFACMLAMLCFVSLLV